MNIRINPIFRRKMIWRIHLPLIMATMMAMVVLLPGVGQAVVIPQGLDFWATDSASVDLSTLGVGLGWVELQGLPFPPDNPLFPKPPVLPGPLPWDVTWLDQHGNVVGPDSMHKVRQVIIPFDTIVQRNTDINITGVGGTAAASIEILWLSLRSKNPINVGPYSAYLYVGLNPDATQIVGRMGLTSDVVDGSKGTVDIGKQIPFTPEAPNDPDYLGLPVNWTALAIPDGWPIDWGHVVYRHDDYSSFHNLSGGEYLIPLPPTAALLGSGLAILLGYGRRRRSRKP